MFSQLLVSVVFSLALAAAASPVVVRENRIKLPFTRHANFTGKDFVKNDRARAQALKSRSSRVGMKVDAERAKSAASAFGVDATNNVVEYTAEVMFTIVAVYCDELTSPLGSCRHSTSYFQLAY